MWFINELDQGNLSYNIPWSIRLIGEVHVEALEQSLNEIVRRHEIFRTTFVGVDGESAQMIAKQLWIPLTVTNLERRQQPQREAAALGFAAEEAGRLLDLAKGPLLRGQLIRLGAGPAVDIAPHDIR